TLNYAATQPIRGGLAVNVPVLSSDSSVGPIIGSPAVFTAGDSLNQSTAFDPVGAGTATISITTPAGFTTPSNFQQITATVTAPTISLHDVLAIRDLETSAFISLAATPPGPVTVTVTSNSGSIATISKDGTIEGGSVLTFT